MTTTASPESAQAASSRRNPGDEQAVRAIIASARKPSRLPARIAWICAAASAGLWWASFHPLDCGPLGFLAAVPLLLLARLADKPRHLYRAVFVAWLAGSLAQLAWMAANPPMIAGWIGMAIYLAMYPVLFLAALRVASWRLGLPLVLSAPVLWTGLEFLRAHLFTGFSWYYLAHTQWRWTTLIQISDLVGAYGVSFVVMTCAAAIAISVPRVWLLKLIGARPAVPATVVAEAPPVRRLVAIGGAIALLAASLGYGAWRISHGQFASGPRVALVQGNFPSRLGSNPSPAEVWGRHNRLTAMSVRYQPDFIFWPESAFRWPMFAAPEGISDVELGAIAKNTPYGALSAQDWRMHAETVRDQLGDLATQAGAAMLIGTSVLEADPDEGLRRFNTAVFTKPEVGVAGRYDKQHRVVFGEYIPLREQLPFLQALSPYTDAFSIDAGTTTAVFEYQNQNIAPVICFEDTVPHLVRGMVASAREAGRPIDLLVNASNDGWFDHSSEQPQHLVISLFRAVETRTPLARAANTGVSAVIDGNGQIVTPVAFLADSTLKPGTRPASMYDESGDFRKDVEALLVADVPLDARQSPYVSAGDWFAGFCGAACCFVLAWGVFRWWKPRAVPAG